MSEQSAPTTESTSVSGALPDPLFTPQELAEFDKDDVQAGSVIGKMLALFFIYTVVVMSLAAWWTASVTGE